LYKTVSYTNSWRFPARYNRFEACTIHLQTPSW